MFEEHVCEMCFTKISEHRQPDWIENANRVATVRTGYLRIFPPPCCPGCSCQSGDSEQYWVTRTTT